MKKRIKIFSLVIFILLVLGITTSKTLAVDVDSNTDIGIIVDALKNKQSLSFGDSYDVYKNHSEVFCRQKGGYLRHFASEYTIEKRVEYPDGENIKTESGKTYENRYAIAYVFAYGKDKYYSKGDIQAAYWNLLGYPPTGDGNGKHKYEYTNNAKTLHDKGLLYQNFKIQENNLKNNIGEIFKVEVGLNDKGTNTEIQNNQLIYGPIKIHYACAGDFGGFNFEVNGTNVTTTNVQLCKKDGDEYTNIDEGNDRKIRTAEHSGEDLYIKVDLNQVTTSKIDVKFKYNSIDATAILYQITGKHKETGTATIYCEQCVDKMDNAIDYTKANTKGQIVTYDKKYWVYDKQSDFTLVRYNVNNEISYPKYVFGDYENKNDLVERKG